MLSPTDKSELADNGVVLLRGAFSVQTIEGLVEEYEHMDAGAVQMEPPKHQPIVVYWTHVPGQRKRIILLDEMKSLRRFTRQVATIMKELTDLPLRLLETVIFNKPPQKSDTLRWHQDVSYFPFEPNNQIAVWLPFDTVTKESGALVYALGSHKSPLRASTDLHSGALLNGETRKPIPEDPAAEGFPTACMEMKPGDMLIHDGRTWHSSGPNLTTERPRRALSLRFLVGETRYAPRPGSGAAFIKQIDVKPGGVIEDPAFPVLP